MEITIEVLRSDIREYKADIEAHWRTIEDLTSKRNSHRIKEVIGLIEYNQELINRAYDRLIV